MDEGRLPQCRPEALRAEPGTGLGETATDPGEHQRRERLLVRLLDLASQPFVVIDLDGRFAHVNRAFESLVGYSAEELRALTYRDLTPEPSLEFAETHLRNLRDLGVTQRFEQVYRHRDGHEIQVELVTDLYRDEVNGPVGYYAFVSEIGERKRAETALRSSEERFRRLYDEAPVGYHTIDPEGRIRDVNRTECEMLGYSREEMIGRPIFDFVDEPIREQARQAVASRVKGEQPVMSVERTYRTKDGRRLNVAIENRLVRDDQGEVIGIRSTVQDVTWKRQAEAALVASERRARALFEGIEDAVFVHDLEGHILDANPAASRRLGYTREEFLTLTTRDIDDPSFAGGFEDRLQQQLREGRLRIEGRHRTKDGRIIPVDINTSTIQLENQTMILAVIRDMTDRKALEETRRQFAEAQLRNAWEIERKNQALVESESRYRQLTEASLDSIVVTDSEGRVTLFNPAAERTYGCPAADAIGRSCEDFFAISDRSRVLTGLREYQAGQVGQLDGSPSSRLETPSDEPLVGQTVELRGRRFDGGEFPLELSLSAAEVGDGLQFIFAIRDQTERQRMRAMLLQSERLVSIGSLSAGVAHEINNPLAFIANNLAVLDREVTGILRLVAAYEPARAILEDQAPAILSEIRAAEEDLDWDYVRANLERMLSRTREGVQRVANIVQNLRGYAHMGPAKREPARLADLVASALEMVRGRLRREHIELRVEHSEREFIVCVPSQIGQVILNLLINAIQAIESLDRAEGKAITIQTRRESDWQLLEIADNGCGISPEALPHLFDPFFTTKPVGEGTGLGLSISHGIVTAHGGRIEVESRPGVGTRFRVWLPQQARGTNAMTQTPVNDLQFGPPRGAPRLDEEHPSSSP